MIIGFEGLDGVGKTSLALNVARHVGGVMLGKLTDDDILKKEREIVNSGDNVEARFDFFVKLNKHQIEQAEEQSVRIVTLESTIYRTVATHCALGSLAAQNYSIKENETPDITILLMLDEAERCKRLIARDGTTGHNRWDNELNNKQGQLMELFEKFNLPTIDASKSHEQITTEAVRLIKNAT